MTFTLILVVGLIIWYRFLQDDDDNDDHNDPSGYIGKVYEVPA